MVDQHSIHRIAEMAGQKPEEVARIFTRVQQNDPEKAQRLNEIAMTLSSDELNMLPQDTREHLQQVTAKTLQIMKLNADDIPQAKAVVQEARRSGTVATLAGAAFGASLATALTFAFPLALPLTLAAGAVATLGGGFGGYSLTRGKVDAAERALERVTKRSDQLYKDYTEEYVAYASSAGQYIGELKAKVDDAKQRVQELAQKEGKQAHSFAEAELIKQQVSSSNVPGASPLR